MPVIDYRDRIFQMWAYTVGMGRLLLRATKTPTFQTRIDVLFQDVRAVVLPARLEGVSVRIGSSADRSRVVASIGQWLSADVDLYVIEGMDYVGYVLASVCMLHEDEGEYDEESVLLRHLNG
jgi:hypothetical protein